MLSASTMDRLPPVDPFRSHLESLELAGKILEKHMNADNSFPTFPETVQIPAVGGPTVSGQADPDYPNISGISDCKWISLLNKYPLPPEVMEHFRHMQCQCNMGLFPEISRAWITIDSDIYLWTYEHGSDVAYFDGLGETILSVGLTKPKPGIFNNFVRNLLVLTTTVEIVVLGVSFSASREGPLGALEEMHLLPEPVFVLPTDGILMTTTACTHLGRIFLGGGDGSLYEVVYQAESTWFGKRCKKVNHSTGALSFLIPTFIAYAFSVEDKIAQISIDNTRNILYTLSEKGTVQVFDLGTDGVGMSRVTSVSQSAIANSAYHLVKTLDLGVFSPVVSISAVESTESAHLNFVLVTKSGVRLYFSTSNLKFLSVRPYTVELLHVRLPPGFAANSLPNRPSNVHLASYRKGTLVMISSPGGDKDALWCLNNDLYPFKLYLSEMQTILSLDGGAWALTEVRGQDAEDFLTCMKVTAATPTATARAATAPLLGASYPVSPAGPPSIVRQHLEPPRKYVVLTSQGVDVFLKLRPVDILKQLMVESRGPEGPPVHRFFKELKEEQACATALILACLDTAQNTQIIDWAARAFFLYGGDPKAAVEAPSNLQYSMQGGFNPPTVSTPLPGNTYGQTQATPGPRPAFGTNITTPGFGSPSPYSPMAHQSQSMSIIDSGLITFSAKHNGLYIYAARVLSPIWNLRTVRITKPDKTVEFICSVLSRDDCVSILSHLHGLLGFLNRHGPLSLFGSQSAQKQVDSSTPVQGRSRFGARDTRDPHQEERRSLEAFKAFIIHTCEVLGLWKILCEHQFHIVASALSKEHQNNLLASTFRNLILIGHELCTMLVNCLINSYLNDNASVDSISAKLREVCPHLYRSEDAACSKANEMLLSAKHIHNTEERQKKLNTALKLCKDVAPHVNLPLVCQWFAQSQYYEGILELCITCAQKLDPRDVGTHFYNNNEPPGDEEGYRAFVDRMECYKEIMAVLDFLQTQNDKTQFQKLIHCALNTNDELLHVSLYNWLMSKQMLSDLSIATQPSYARYIKRQCDRGQDIVFMNDLLWKYYEKNNNHAAAAKVLLKLATTPGNMVALSDRIGYLARAVMCMRSDKVGSTPHLGVFLRELEDKIEVARLQQQILDAISVKPRTAKTAETIVQLNSGLMDITALYENFAEPYELWESKLAIIHCSGHHDQALIEHVWLNIIESELKNSTAKNNNDRMALVLSKIKSLGQDYSLSPRCFPVAFLVYNLELHSCRLRADQKLVYQIMLALGVHILKLIQIYDSLVSENDVCWFKSGNEFHIHEVIGYFIEEFVSNPKLVPHLEKRLIATKAGDLLTKCLTSVFTKPNTKSLRDRLQGVQAKLNRFSNEP